MAVKNRIVCPPMVRNWATGDDLVTGRLIDNYAAIAVGGVGMIVVEAAYIHPIGKGFVDQLGIYADQCVAGLKCSRVLSRSSQTEMESDLCAVDGLR